MKIFQTCRKVKIWIVHEHPPTCSLRLHIQVLCCCGRWNEITTGRSAEWQACPFPHAGTPSPTSVHVGCNATSEANSNNTTHQHAPSTSWFLQHLTTNDAPHNQWCTYRPHPSWWNHMAIFSKKTMECCLPSRCHWPQLGGLEQTAYRTQVVPLLHAHVTGFPCYIKCVFKMELQQSFGYSTILPH